MSRGAGRKGTGREDWIGELLADLGVSGNRPQTEGERREEGIGDERDIPGGKNHLANPESDPPPGYGKPAEWRYRKDLAHGVDPDEAGHHDRDGQHGRPAGGQSGKAPLEGEPEEKLFPVPVYIVENAGTGRVKATAAMRRITLPAAGSEPVTICAASESRALVQVLNEDSTHNARLGNLEDLNYDFSTSQFYGGARLPAGATGYTVFRTKEQVFGVSETSSTVVVSVILEDEVRGIR